MVHKSISKQGLPNTFHHQSLSPSGLRKMLLFASKSVSYTVGQSSGDGRSALERDVELVQASSRDDATVVAIQEYRRRGRDAKSATISVHKNRFRKLSRTQLQPAIIQQQWRALKAAIRGSLL
jgi:hypothetical protein